MKRFGGLWPSVIDFQNLYQAYRKARLGKTDRIDVARFDANLERELFRLRDELANGQYQCGKYRQFTLYERKPRLISAAPFRDRVVHHAIMRVIEPLIDPRFIADTFACRPDKGVHNAVDRYQAWAQRYRYVLKIDISRYFPSVDHALLKAIVRRHLKDQALLVLLDHIIDEAPSNAIQSAPLYFEGDDLFSPTERRVGLPIGNLTSQFFANLYLNGLDHFIKERLRVAGYLRYVDDMILLSDSKEQLWAWLAEIERELGLLRLCVHSRKRHLCPTEEGLDVLGYRVFHGYRHLRDDNAHRFARKLRSMACAYAEGRFELANFRPSICSWLGHARHTDTAALQDKIFSATIFSRQTQNGKVKSPFALA